MNAGISICFAVTGAFIIALIISVVIRVVGRWWSGNSNGPRI